MTKIIHVVSKGEPFEILIDDEDYNRVNVFKWNIARDDHRRYAISTIHMGLKKKSTIRMHQLVMSFPLGFVIDHKNGNGLDNRVQNLRVCTQLENIKNRVPNKGRCLPKGVFMDKKRFRARVTNNGKTYNIGTFRTTAEASAAYNSAARELFGEFYNKGNL